MLSILFRQSTLYAASNVLVRAVNFLVLPVYARAFSPEQFGIYELITVFSAFAGLIVAMEITQGLARYYAEATSDRDKVEYASSALWFTLIAYTVFCTGAIALADPLSRALLGSSDGAGTIRVALLAVWSNGLCYAAQNQLRWQLYARYYSISSVAAALTSQGAALAFILLLGAGLSGIFWGSFLGGLAGTATAAYYGRASFAARLSWRKVGTMLRFSAPLAASGLAVFASRYVDRLVIKEMVDIHAVGLYGIAARFAALASFALAGVQGALIPLITAFHREERAPTDIARTFRYFLACAMPAALFVTLYSREIMVTLAGSSYESGHSLIPWLAIGTLLSGMYVFMPGLWLAKHTLHTLAINVVSALLALVLSLILVRSLGVLGAAVAYAIGAGANFTALFVLSQRRYRLPIDSRRIGGSLVLFTFLVITGGALAQADEVTHLARAAFAVVGMLAMVLILVSPAEMKRLAAGAYRELRPG